MEMACLKTACRLLQSGEPGRYCKSLYLFSSLLGQWAGCRTSRVLGEMFKCTKLSLSFIAPDLVNFTSLEQLIGGGGGKSEIDQSKLLGKKKLQFHYTIRRLVPIGFNGAENIWQFFFYFFFGIPTFFGCGLPEPENYQFFCAHPLCPLTHFWAPTHCSYKVGGTRWDFCSLGHRMSMKIFWKSVSVAVVIGIFTDWR